MHLDGKARAGASDAVRAGASDTAPADANNSARSGTSDSVRAVAIPKTRKSNKINAFTHSN